VLLTAAESAKYVRRRISLVPSQTHKCNDPYAVDVSDAGASRRSIVFVAALALALTLTVLAGDERRRRAGHVGAVAGHVAHGDVHRDRAGRERARVDAADDDVAVTRARRSRRGRGAVGERDRDEVVRVGRLVEGDEHLHARRVVLFDRIRRRADDVGDRGRRRRLRVLDQRAGEGRRDAVPVDDGAGNRDRPVGQAAQIGRPGQLVAAAGLRRQVDPADRQRDLVGRVGRAGEGRDDRGGGLRGRVHVAGGVIRAGGHADAGRALGAASVLHKVPRPLLADVAVRIRLLDTELVRAIREVGEVEGADRKGRALAV